MSRDVLREGVSRGGRTLCLAGACGAKTLLGAADDESLPTMADSKRSATDNRQLIADS